MPYPLQTWKNLADSIPIAENNRPTLEGVALGRMLFYDPILSANNKVSCASCHAQNLAFSDGLPLGGKGITGKQGMRNSPAIINVAWMPGLFWDGGVTGAESFAYAPIQHPDEMGSNLKQVVAELQASPNYPSQFKAAFGSDTINTQMVAHALAQFMRTMVSGNSRYDRFIRREKGQKLSKYELQGYRLFNMNCSQCHSGELFTDNAFHNIGLPLKEGSKKWDESNLGRFRITHDTADWGKYKTPTLRNITLTAPYMHDGRFKTLEEVMFQYRFQTANYPNLDIQLQNKNGKPGLLMDNEEQAQILAFLKCLTDTSFIQNKNFGPPSGVINP